MQTPPDTQKYLYFARIDHPNEFIYAQNVLDYCAENEIPAREIIIQRDGSQRMELKDCLADAFVVVSTNWHLDHSIIGDRPFLELAAEAGVPVVQWLLDHPSHLWRAFERSDAESAQYLFHSSHTENYFKKFIMPDCRSAQTVCVGQNRHSRIAELTKSSFEARDFPCLVAFNLKRLEGDLQEMERKLAALPARLRNYIREGVEIAYNDLQYPIETYFVAVTGGPEFFADANLFHRYVGLIDDIVQIKRRVRVFEVASEFPVLLQSDYADRYLPRGHSATLEKNVGMLETLRRIPRAKSLIGLSPIAALHERTLNGINAGTLVVLEDKEINRQFFKHEENALFFRYDDDSLRAALDFIFSKPAKAFEIAEAGFALRDDPRLRFGGFNNFLPFGSEWHKAATARKSANVA